MSQQRLTLRQFCELYIGHNTKLYLYSRRIVIENGVRVKYDDQLWKGMDWQAAYSPYDEGYFEAHPDVEKCPYENWLVEQVIKATEGFSDAVDEVALIIRDPATAENDNSTTLDEQICIDEIAKQAAYSSGLCQRTNISKEG